MASIASRIGQGGKHLVFVLWGKQSHNLELGARAILFDKCDMDSFFGGFERSQELVDHTDACKGPADNDNLDRIGRGHGECVGKEWSGVERECIICCLWLHRSTLSFLYCRLRDRALSEQLTLCCISTGFKQEPAIPRSRQPYFKTPSLEAQLG